MSHQDVLVGVDIGTSKIKIVVANCIQETLKIKTAAEYPSFGVHKGQVKDVEKIAKALANAISVAERSSGIEIHEIFLNISGPEVKGRIIKASLMISRFSHRVNEWDIIRVIELARQTEVPVGTEVVCAVPRRFFVDGQLADEPIGLKGQLLEVEVVLILASTKAVQDRFNVARRLGLEASALTPNIVASAGAVLQNNAQGVMVVDVGASLTDIALFDSHGLCWMTSLPIGGQYITKDISFGLQVSEQEAEGIKLQYGSLDTIDVIDSFYLTGDDSISRKVNKKFLVDIIDSRIMEMYQLIEKSFLESGHQDKLLREVVFTGGVTKIPGFIKKATRYFNIPVRLGVAEIDNKYHSPEFSNSIGLIICGAPSNLVIEQSASAKDYSNGVIKRLVRRLRGFF